MQCQLQSGWHPLMPEVNFVLNYFLSCLWLHTSEMPPRNPGNGNGNQMQMVYMHVFMSPLLNCETFSGFALLLLIFTTAYGFLVSSSQDVLGTTTENGPCKVALRISLRDGWALKRLVWLTWYSLIQHNPSAGVFFPRQWCRICRIIWTHRTSRQLWDVSANVSPTWPPQTIISFLAFILQFRGVAHSKRRFNSFLVQLEHASSTNMYLTKTFCFLFIFLTIWKENANENVAGFPFLVKDGNKSPDWVHLYVAEEDQMFWCSFHWQFQKLLAKRVWPIFGIKLFTSLPFKKAQSCIGADLGSFLIRPLFCPPPLFVTPLLWLVTPPPHVDVTPIWLIWLVTPPNARQQWRSIP